MSETNTTIAPPLPTVPNLDSVRESKTEDDDKVDMLKIGNVGKTFKLSTGKEFTAKQLGVIRAIDLIGSTVEIWQDVINLVTKKEIQEEVLSSDHVFLMKVLTEDRLKNQAFKIVCAFLRIDSFDELLDDEGDISFEDAILVYENIKDVVDWEELKENFSKTGLQKFLTTSPISTETSETSDQPPALPEA